MPLIGNMGDNMIDNEGKIIMGDKANCDTNSHITDELHSQIREEQGGGGGKKKTSIRRSSTK